MGQRSFIIQRRGVNKATCDAILGQSKHANLYNPRNIILHKTINISQSHLNTIHHTLSVVQKVFVRRVVFL